MDAEKNKTAWCGQQRQHAPRASCTTTRMAYKWPVHNKKSVRNLQTLRLQHNQHPKRCHITQRDEIRNACNEREHEHIRRFNEHVDSWICCYRFWKAIISHVLTKHYAKLFPCVLINALTRTQIEIQFRWCSGRFMMEIDFTSSLLQYCCTCCLATSLKTNIW